jgi:outer membrane protein OmpA-like peptidoglycan-associated protein
MKRSKSYFSILISCFALACIMLSISSVNAQEMFGAANSNFSGTNSLHLNPSTFVDNRLGIDITLIGGGYSIDNDYVYFPKGKVGFLGFGSIWDLSEDHEFADDYDTKAKNMEMIGHGRILSASFHIKDHWFALQPFKQRTAATLDNVHFALAKFAFEEDGIHYTPQHGVNYEVPSFNLGGMYWSEIGLTYGHSIVNKNTDYLKGAITIKRLLGHMSAYTRVDAGAKFIVAYDPRDANPDDTVNPGQIFMEDVNMEYGHSFNDDNDEGFSPFNSDGITGRGWGFDFGLTYEYRPDFAKYRYEMDGQQLEDPTQNQYKLRLGLSVIDVGKITFDENSEAFRLKSDYVQWTGWEDANFDSKEDFDTTFSKLFYQNANGDSLPNESNIGEKYDMGLPRAISLQADYRIARYVFANVSWIQRWKRNSPEVAATNILALTPRFERHWFDVAIPMELYQYDRFRMGIAFRFAGLTIGSDKLGGLLGLTDLGGMDAYASLKFLMERRKIADSDEDGVSDKMDKCPEVKGPWATRGCPDRDNDGIIDSEDVCPDLPGLPALQGCPDKDGDGIADKDDLCPDVPGLAQFQGCPDTDGDGIMDPKDSCVTVPGLAIYDGCPDTDGDSIPDPKDSCVTDKGPIEFHGCPDTDGDGLINKNDSCPLVAGPISNNGCPVVQKVEKPKEPVKVELTKEEEEVINKVFNNLEFETGKATIRESSFASLDELAKLLVKKPNFKLLIDGHTDNVGKAAYNMKLSQNRANSVKTYLVNKGIDASRITSKGYGLTKPIASNKTPEGRQKNRRVEFTIVE